MIGPGKRWVVGTERIRAYWWVRVLWAAQLGFALLLLWFELEAYAQRNRRLMLVIATGLVVLYMLNLLTRNMVRWMARRGPTWVRLNGEFLQALQFRLRTEGVRTSPRELADNEYTKRIVDAYLLEIITELRGEARGNFGMGARLRWLIEPALVGRTNVVVGTTVPRVADQLVAVLGRQVRFKPTSEE